MVSPGVSWEAAASADDGRPRVVLPRDRAAAVLWDVVSAHSLASALITVRDPRGGDRVLLNYRYTDRLAGAITDELVAKDPTFVQCVDAWDDVLDWQDFPSFRFDHMAQTFLVPAGYGQGVSVGLGSGPTAVIGSLHASFAELAVPQETKNALYEAREQLNRIAAGIAQADLAGITGREIEVLTHLALGKTNKQIADDMVIARWTVNGHVENILAKLQVANRVQAVVAGIKLALIDVY